jgi:alanine racemase
VLITSGDVLLTFDHASVDFSRPGVTGVAYFGPVERGSRHGVYVPSGFGANPQRTECVPVVDFLQKPSETEARACGAVDPFGHVAVDTGMGRIGVQPDETGADLVLAVSQLEGVEIEGLFSHYACADCQDKTDAQEQTALFDRFIGLLEGRGVQIPLKHICNSAGAMEMDKQYDMCRLGIALYGLYPSEEVEKKIALIPAMEVISHVVHVKDVPQGFKIGYGHIYEAPAKRKIATVCVGYADGYNRCLTGVGYVLIRGKKAPVVGKVCMDQIMVDVTDIEGVTVGDQAVILGKSQDACISAEELGAMCHSFNYEVVCNFMPRVTRAYYKDGKFRQ